MNTNEAQPSAQEQLAIVVDILASTAERAQLLQGGIIGAVLVEPLTTIDPVELQLSIQQTIAAGSEIMKRLGGVSLIHTDDRQYRASSAQCRLWRGELRCDQRHMGASI